MRYSKEWFREDTINVRVRDIDLKAGTIDIYGGKGYDATEMRKVRCDMQVLRHIKIFSNKSKQVNRSHVYVVVNKIAQKAGIDQKIGYHSFRRLRAEHLRDMHLPLVYVSKQLRHKSISTTWLIWCKCR